MDRRTLVAITAASLVSATLAVVVPRVLATGAPTQSPLVYAGTVTDEGGKPYPQAVDVVLALFDKTDATVPKC
jgi:outer membrane receptor protein involved in Fe transport